MVRWLAVVALALVAGCIVPIGIPSIRADGGYAVRGQPSMRVGTHVAGYRVDRDARWDAGAGYTLTGTTFDPMTSSASGFYVEGAWLHRIDRGTRVGIGPGVNVMFRGPAHEIAPVAYLRASVELFGAVNSTGTTEGRCGSTTGTWRGQLGFGAYVDVQKPMAESGMAVVAGLTIRLPSFAGVAFVIPGCK